MAHLTSQPDITVFMPVYNGEKYIKEAIESILNQTFKNFELLIIDDGSTDRSMEIVNSIQDDRIRIVKNEKNLGIAKTRNKGIDLALGKYIVPMDCDDISLQTRLEKQFIFMEKNPDVGICGTWYEKFGKNVKNIKIKLPLHHNVLKPKFFFECPILNSTCIMRKSLLETYSLKFDENYSILAEDYDFLLRSCFHFKIANIPQVLFKYRTVPTSATNFTKEDEKKKYYVNFLSRNLKIIGMEANLHNLQIYYYLNKGIFPIEEATLINIKDWLNNLLEVNKKSKVFEEPFFSDCVKSLWFKTCSASSKLGFNAMLIYFSSSLMNKSSITPLNILKMLVKCSIKYTRKQPNVDTSIKNLFISGVCPNEQQ